MEQINPLNIFEGPDSLVKYYDPDCQPPLPLVEIPDAINPFRSCGVRIYAKMMTALPAQNVKALPALNMLQKGVGAKTTTVIEQSSGSTVISLSIIARVLHQISDVHAYISNKTQLSRLQMLRFFGLKVILFGGPSQPLISDPQGAIGKARLIASGDRSILNPGQYENDANPEAHVRWTGPQILKQLPEINVFCTGMGTAGSIAGTGKYLKQKKPSVFVIGVCNVTGDPIPGPRPYSLFSSVKFPWSKVTDAIEEVNSAQSYRLSMQLSREGLICGPSSGMALQGLFNVLQKHKDKGTLHNLAGDNGIVACVFLCCDLPFQYLDDYFTKLGEDEFHPIFNKNLLNVDLNLYEAKWEISYDRALKMLYGDRGVCVRLIKSKDQDTDHVPDTSTKIPTLEPDAIIFDLRSDSDFKAGHLPGAVNLPLSSLEKEAPGPFDDSGILEAQWKEIANKFRIHYPLVAFSESHTRVIVLCYHGDTAKIASSVLRARNVAAYSVKGGACDLHNFEGGVTG